MDENISLLSNANRVTLWGTFINVVLTALKLFAGILGNSSAMLADAIHSLSDFITDIIVLIGVRFSSKPHDHDHKYGHGKFETLATALIGLALIIVGIGIAYNGGKSIYSVYQGATLPAPGYIAAIAAFLSIIIKEWLYRWTLHIGKKVKSQALMANAWHHRSDVFSSIGTLLGITGSMVLGEKFTILDPLAALVVSLFIVKVGLSITNESLKELLDSALEIEEESKIIQIISEVNGVVDPHNLRTRKIGNSKSIEIHIRVEAEMSVHNAHIIATKVEQALRAEFGMQTYISVHIEPTK